MGEDQGSESKLQLQEYEEEHQGYTGDDLRVHVGNQGDVHDELAGNAVHVVDADGGGGAVRLSAAGDGGGEVAAHPLCAYRGAALAHILLSGGEHSVNCTRCFIVKR